MEHRRDVLSAALWACTASGSGGGQESTVGSAMGTEPSTATADTPHVLLEHHLKQLRLPTFLREYDKVARQCAARRAWTTRAACCGCKKKRQARRSHVLQQNKRGNNKCHVDYGPERFEPRISPQE